MTHLASILRQHVTQFPTECVQTLIRWFSGDRTGLTLFNVIECTLILGAYFVGLVARGDGDGIRTFGDVAADAVVPLSAEDRAQLEELGRVLGAAPQSHVSGNMAVWIIRRLLAQILDQLHADNPELAEILDQIRKWLGL
ncbi:MAG: hypothetical protein U0795_20210 [Pirellulales bacterium]